MCEQLCIATLINSRPHCEVPLVTVTTQDTTAHGLGMHALHCNLPYVQCNLQHELLHGCAACEMAQHDRGLLPVVTKVPAWSHRLMAIAGVGEPSLMYESKAGAETFMLAGKAAKIEP